MPISRSAVSSIIREAASGSVRSMASVRVSAPVRAVIPEATSARRRSRRATSNTPIPFSANRSAKTAPHPNAAKLFSEWIYSDEGQEQFATWGLQWPVVSDVPGPKGAPELKKIKLIVPDLSFQISDEGRETFLKKFNAAMNRN